MRVTWERVEVCDNKIEYETFLLESTIKLYKKAEVEAASNISAVMGYKMGSFSAIYAKDHCPRPWGR